MHGEQETVPEDGGICHTQGQKKHENGYDIESQTISHRKIFDGFCTIFSIDPPYFVKQRP